MFLARYLIAFFVFLRNAMGVCGAAM